MLYDTKPDELSKILDELNQFVFIISYGWFALYSHCAIDSVRSFEWLQYVDYPLWPTACNYCSVLSVIADCFLPLKMLSLIRCDKLRIDGMFLTGGGLDFNRTGDYADYLLYRAKVERWIFCKILFQRFFDFSKFTFKYRGHWLNTQKVIDYTEQSTDNFVLWPPILIPDLFRATCFHSTKSRLDWNLIFTPNSKESPFDSTFWQQILKETIRITPNKILIARRSLF